MLVLLSTGQETTDHLAKLEYMLSDKDTAYNENIFIKHDHPLTSIPALVPQSLPAT